MDKITCKHCGTKYSADVSKCPVCGTSNAPAVSDGFEFLDDEEFEATANEAPEEKDTAPETENKEVPESGKKDTGSYSWEDIIAEINGGKADEEQPGRQEEAKTADSEMPEWNRDPEKQEDETLEDEEDREESRPYPERRRRDKKRGKGSAVLVVLAVVALLAAAVLAAKYFGLFDKPAPEEEEAPNLPVVEEQDVNCTGVTLSESELTLMALGETQTLTATIQPEDCTEKINWISADPSVVTVDDSGIVTAIAEGTANILVSCGDYAATCLVTVTLTPEEEQDNPEAQGEGEGATQGEEEPEGEMELSATDITMTYPGELARLYVNNSGDKEVTWSTDNETLLTVDSTGLIMARATGTAHVYAEVDGQRFECIVRCNLGGVEGEPITVSLNTTDISMFYEGETFQFEVNYENGEPEGVTHEWTSSDESVCTVDADGVVTAVGNGTAYVSTVADGVNLKCIVRVNFQNSTDDTTETGSTTEG